MGVSEFPAHQAKLLCAISRRGTKDGLRAFASRAMADGSRFPALALRSDNWAPGSFAVRPAPARDEENGGKTPASRLSRNPSSEISSYTENSSEKMGGIV